MTVASRSLRSSSPDNETESLSLTWRLVVFSPSKGYEG